jgi:general secretion pathway protein F
MVQLSDLLDAGCPLSRALAAIARQSAQAPLAKLAEGLNAEIVNGASLAGAMERMRRYFSDVQVSMVRAAETGGFLQKTLATLARHAAQQADAIKHIKAKLAYPAVLAITAVASVIFLLTWVVPRFTQVYRAAHKLLPGPTRALLAVSSFLGTYRLELIVAVVVVVLGGRALLRWGKFRVRLDGLVLRMPVFGPVFRDWEMSRLAGTMSLLLTGGITVLRSLRLSAQVVRNLSVRREVEALASAVERGEPLSGRMRNSPFFDATTTEMIVVSEASGKLASVLNHLSAQRHRDFQAKTDALLSLVEPAIILVVGVLVGLTVVALLLPVLLMNTLVG